MLRLLYTLIKKGTIKATKNYLSNQEASVISFVASNHPCAKTSHTHSLLMNTLITVIDSPHHMMISVELATFLSKSFTPGNLHHT